MYIIIAFFADSDGTQHYTETCQRYPEALIVVCSHLKLPVTLADAPDALNH